MEEIWKDIDGYEGLYQVSNLGRVKGLEREIWIRKRKGHARRIKGVMLRQCPDKDGYFTCVLCKNNICINGGVHRIVAKAFVENPKPNEYPIVNHIDCNNQNNRSDNLEWCNNSHNIKHAYRNGRCRDQRGEKHNLAVLTADKVLWIRKNYIERDKEFGGRALARKFGVCYATISSVIKNKIWKHI